MNQNIHEAQRLIKPEERPDEIVVTELKRATDWADCQCHGKGLIPNVDKYASLENVLHRALEQARSGTPPASRLTNSRCSASATRSEATTDCSTRPSRRRRNPPGCRRSSARLSSFSAQ